MRLAVVVCLVALPVGSCGFRAVAADRGADGGWSGFELVPSSVTVDEHQPFLLHIVALDARGQPEADYAGTPTLSTNWGDLVVRGPISFTAGSADVTVSLNRETGPTHKTVTLEVSDGTRSGAFSGIAVAAPGWSLLDAQAIFGPGSWTPSTSRRCCETRTPAGTRRWCSARRPAAFSALSARDGQLLPGNSRKSVRRSSSASMVRRWLASSNT